MPFQTARLMENSFPVLPLLLEPLHILFPYFVGYEGGRTGSFTIVLRLLRFVHLISEPIPNDVALVVFPIIHPGIYHPRILEQKTSPFPILFARMIQR